MPRSMVPFPYSPWPFLDFGQDPDPNGAPPLPNAPVPNVPGVTIPWSVLPPIAPPPSVPPPAAPPPETASEPPSDTPGFDKTFAPQPPPPPVAQAPRNPSLADIIAPWMQPPEPESPPPALPPSETPGLDKAIARMNAPTPGFHLTPGLGGFSQPPMWSLPPPPQLLPIPPLPVPPRSGGLGALGSTLPPMAPALSPLIRTSGGPAALTAGPLSGTEAGAGIPETLAQMARRLMPFATRFGAAATAAGQILLQPWSQQDATVDLGNGLRLRKQLDPGPAILEQYRPDAFGIGGEWQRLLIDARTTLGKGSYEQLQVDPNQLRAVLGEETTNRLLNTPGILPMAKPPSDEQLPSLPENNSAGTPPEPDKDQEPPKEPPHVDLTNPASKRGNNSESQGASAGSTSGSQGSGNEGNGWGDPASLQDHFERHGSDFGSASADDYARQAQDFLRRAQRERLPTKIDSNGVTRIYDPINNIFGAYNADCTTKTFFKPSPTRHPYPTNMDYWNAQPGLLQGNR